MYDQVTTVNLLYDFYGRLLTKRQSQVMMLYYEENLSLSEIADEFGISRQGVHDALRNGEKSLRDYEEKLGFVKKFEETAESVARIDGIINRLAENENLPPEVKKELLEVRNIIDSINE